MQKLFIITNERIYEDKNKYYCDNIDIKSTPEGLDKSFDINLIARKSRTERSFNIDLKDIKVFNSIFAFILAVIKSTQIKNTKYLVISISPYTFIATIFLKLFGKSPIIYLRSDGYSEYKTILGFIGPFIYHFMFMVSSSISNLISCRKYILKGKKGSIVSPSQLDASWFENVKDKEIFNTNLLYVGRIRKEKGIFSLLELIKAKKDILLTVVGEEKSVESSISQNNVKIFKNETNKENLIRFYDAHSILILPSFTEGHPMVILEALARKRPVIIFEEIKHVIGDKKGIFVSKRNYNSLSETINLIKSDYKNIQTQIGKNNLPTKKIFIDQMVNIISDLN